MTVDTRLNSNNLPLLPLDLSQHKLPIFLNWFPIVLTSGVLPIIGYFALRYGTDLELNTVWAPWLGLMGVVSLFALFKRSWFLIKEDSTCRPLAQESRWGLDYFGWNFLFGFLVLTAFISAGIASENITVVSLPTSILLLYVCFQLILVPILKGMGVRAFVRFSSTARGEPLKAATYVIVEDVVAVDGQQGQQFRQALLSVYCYHILDNHAWKDRYEASPVMRAHLGRMDLMWGSTGLAIVAVIWGLVFGLNTSPMNQEIAYALGWALPWIWAGVMTIITISMSKSMLRNEGQMQGGGNSA